MADKLYPGSSHEAFEQEMLCAAASETAPASARRRALAGLGLLAVAPTAAAASTVGNTAGKALWWQASLSKAALAIAVGGTVVGGGLALRGTFGKTPPLPKASSAIAMRSGPAALLVPSSDEGANAFAPAAASPAATESAPAPPSPKPSSSASGRARSVTLQNREPTTTSKAKPATEMQRAASIRDEIDLVDRARTAIRQGQPQQAKVLMDQYFARHPNGELGQEAALVRADAARALQP